MSSEFCGNCGRDEGIGPVDEEPDDQQEPDVTVVAGVVNFAVQRAIFSEVLVREKLKINSRCYRTGV